LFEFLKPLDVLFRRRLLRRELVCVDESAVDITLLLGSEHCGIVIVAVGNVKIRMCG